MRRGLQRAGTGAGVSVSVSPRARFLQRDGNYLAAVMTSGMTRVRNEEATETSPVVQRVTRPAPSSYSSPRVSYIVHVFARVGHPDEPEPRLQRVATKVELEGTAYIPSRSDDDAPVHLSFSRCSSVPW